MVLSEIRMIYGLFVKQNGKDVVKVLVLVMDRGALGGHYHALGNCAEIQATRLSQLGQ